MAILRGGKRIGPFDLRIGLPRGREYENIPGDPRLKGRANPETTINRFRAALSQGEGLARPNRFLVEFSLPKKSYLQSKIQVQSGPPHYPKEKRNLDMHHLDQMLGKRVRIMCNKITLPERQFTAAALRQYGPAFQYPTNVQYGSISATFYLSKFYEERQYFEAWQNAMFDHQTNNFNFWDEYTSHVDIFQLGSFDEKNDRDHITYGVRLFEAYPLTVGAVELDSSTTNQAATCSITFNYRLWLNYNVDIDEAGNVGGLTSGVVKEGTGGFIDRLPPSIRSTARNALATIKRSIPIGRVFGGKIFPPFT